MSKTVGILGGMGPMSTVDLMRMVTERTPVKREREHLRILVDSRPQIPDRPAALLGTGESPVPMMRESARLLEQWGADLIAIPCNTAHGFLAEVQEAVDVEILDMIGLVGRELSRSFPEGAVVGLLATAATAEARVFHDKLPRFDLLTPSPAVHETLVAPAILQVKLENVMEGPRASLLRAVSTLEPEPGAVIAGCTEVELALSEAEAPFPIILPMTLLAQEIVDRAWRG
ncbi:MAG: aspartate/glutamate racemase family protein [Longimicrobiales bacterium]